MACSQQELFKVLTTFERKAMNAPADKWYLAVIPGLVPVPDLQGVGAWYSSGLPNGPCYYVAERGKKLNRWCTNWNSWWDAKGGAWDFLKPGQYLVAGSMESGQPGPVMWSCKIPNSAQAAEILPTAHRTWLLLGALAIVVVLIGVLAWRYLI